MKCKFKALLSICLVLCMCYGLCTVTALAAEVPTETASAESVQPRIGMAGYRNYYHNGNGYYGEYTISTSSLILPLKQYTVELGDFDSDTLVIIEIYNSKGQLATASYFSAQGNGKWENKSLKSTTFINGDTYTIKYNVYNGLTPLSGDDGWIGIWFY